MARIVAASVPHHVTQRGNRRQNVFFSDSDYECYRAMLAEGCHTAGGSNRIRAKTGEKTQPLAGERKPGPKPAEKANQLSAIIARIINYSVP